MTDLSIIIVTYKGWKRLEKCLHPVATFRNAVFKKEVIIVDNTPDPDEISPVKQKYPGFTYLHNTVNGGFANGSNTGAGIAAGKYLLFLNPDTVASESAIDKLIEAAEKNRNWMILSCRQVNEKGKECIVTGSFPEFLTLTGTLRAIFGKKKQVDHDCDVIFPEWTSGSVILMRKEDFVRLHGFDEDFWMYYEDMDICRRVLNSGGTVALLNNITIEHNHGGSSRIDTRTASLTKTEVHISRHVYISKHKARLTRAGMQSFLVVNNLITNFLTAIPGLILFFLPKLFVRTLIFKNLVYYYFRSAFRGSWISSRSVKYLKNR